MKIIYNGRVIEEKGRLVSGSIPDEFEDLVPYESRDAFPEEGQRGRIYLDEGEGLPYLWNAAQNNYVPLRVDNDGGEF
jgi:hypothetical protein